MKQAQKARFLHSKMEKSGSKTDIQAGLFGSKSFSASKKNFSARKKNLSARKKNFSGGKILPFSREKSRIKHHKKFLSFFSNLPYPIERISIKRMAKEMHAWTILRSIHRHFLSLERKPKTRQENM